MTPTKPFGVVFDLPVQKIWWSKFCLRSFQFTHITASAKSFCFFPCQCWALTCQASAQNCQLTGFSVKCSLFQHLFSLFKSYITAWRPFPWIQHAGETNVRHTKSTLEEPPHTTATFYPTACLFPLSRIRVNTTLKTRKVQSTQQLDISDLTTFDHRKSLSAITGGAIFNLKCVHDLSIFVHWNSGLLQYLKTESSFSILYFRKTFISSSSDKIMDFLCQLLWFMHNDFALKKALRMGSSVAYKNLKMTGPYT